MDKLAPTSRKNSSHKLGERSLTFGPGKDKELRFSLGILTFIGQVNGSCIDIYYLWNLELIEFHKHIGRNNP